MRFNYDLRRYILFAIVSAAVLMLWFGFGFLVPLMFPSLQQSGQWGDGFNSVSSLFNGLGFIALFYTILLQIKSLQVQRNQELFKFLYDHLSNLDNSIMKFELEGAKGLAGIDKFIDYAKNYRIKSENDPSLHYLFSIVRQVVALNGMLQSNKSKLSSDEFITLRSRLEGFQSNYLQKIKDMHPLHTDHVGSISDLIRVECQRAIAFIDRLYD